MLRAFGGPSVTVTTRRKAAASRKIVMLLSAAGVAALLQYGSAVAQQPAAPTPAAAAPAASTAPQRIPLNLAILDFDLVVNTSKAAKAANEALKKRTEGYEAELNKQQKALVDAVNKLRKDQATLSPEELKKREDALRQQDEKLRQQVQTRGKELQEMRLKVSREIREALVAVTADIAKERQYTLVLNKDSVVLAANAFDISNEVLKRLDAKLPAVKLK